MKLFFKQAGGKTEDGGWRQIGLLKTFQGEMWDGERFFVILKRSAEELALHLDLLELGYLCLSLGYQGKYDEKPDGCGDFSRSFFQVTP
ncbi:type IVB secretion system protein IcmH/DotU [Candidatus Coxiella mudrowiae]|uniref:type IVB secretion system protein IcmH/DotU n=1 Tax=Candidatus Coxiella mudrowiae TaxID=2054173 RepID=UPI000AA0C7EA|nr:type IVB secretion system protein IcmH/DotU [Candidatus Coxiella mudrowiae]